MNAQKSNILIRLATPEDDIRLGELLVHAFVDTYARKMPEVEVTDKRKADLRDIASKRATMTIYVAEVNGEIAGTATVVPPGHPKGRAWISQTADLRYLAVDPRFHGKGVAAELVAQCREGARSSGACGIVLHIRKGAYGLNRFYERQGYTRAPEGDEDLLPEIYLEAYQLRF